jgi:hypothetical protein
MAGPGREKNLPDKDSVGIYHIDSSLAVADEAPVTSLGGPT